MRFYNLSDQGMLLPCESTNNNFGGQIKNRILRFKNDCYDKFGIFVLTDDKPAENVMTEYLDVEECSLFTFPFTARGVSNVALGTIKQGKYF